MDKIRRQTETLIINKMNPFSFQALLTLIQQTPELCPSMNACYFESDHCLFSVLLDGSNMGILPFSLQIPLRFDMKLVTASIENSHSTDNEEAMRKFLEHGRLEAIKHLKVFNGSGDNYPAIAALTKEVRRVILGSKFGL